MYNPIKIGDSDILKQKLKVCVRIEGNYNFMDPIGKFCVIG